MFPMQRLRLPMQDHDCNVVSARIFILSCKENRSHSIVCIDEEKVSLGRNALKLTTSKIASSAAGFALAPIIVRMFIPEDFGILQVFTSILSVLGVLSYLRYELSIPLGKTNQEASASFALSVIVSLIFSLI